MLAKSESLAGVGIPGIEKVGFEIGGGALNFGIAGGCLNIEEEFGAALDLKSSSVPLFERFTGTGD